MTDNRFNNGQQCVLSGNPLGSLTFEFQVQTDSTNSSYTLVHASQFRFRVIGVTGIMTGAGGTSDTIKVTDGTNDITDTIDVSALADKSVFSAATIDDAYWNIDVGESLKVVTASAALAFVMVKCVRV
jgi:hypothetical protein